MLTKRISKLLNRLLFWAVFLAILALYWAFVMNYPMAYAMEHWHVLVWLPLFFVFMCGGFLPWYLVTRLSEPPDSLRENELEDN